MASEIYPDSSFLFSLVAQDSSSDEASAYMARTAAPLVFTPLHRIEVRNALRNAAARREISAQERRSAFRLIEEDLDEGLFVHLLVHWTEVFRRADELSERHSIGAGQRTLDLLHVAIAIESGAKTFLSFDRRQRRLAAAAGLRVRP